MNSWYEPPDADHHDACEDQPDRCKHCGDDIEWTSAGKFAHIGDRPYRLMCEIHDGYFRPVEPAERHCICDELEEGQREQGD